MERCPWEWAETCERLGHAQVELGKRTGDASHFEYAVTAYESSLVVYGRDQVPEAWANVSVSMGVALALLGEHKEGMPSLLAAESRIDGAIEEFGKDGSKVAAAMERLLDVYAVAVSLGDDLNRIRDAVARKGRGDRRRDSESPEGTGIDAED